MLRTKTIDRARGVAQCRALWDQQSEATTVYEGPRDDLAELARDGLEKMLVLYSRGDCVYVAPLRTSDRAEMWVAVDGRAPLGPSKRIKISQFVGRKGGTIRTNSAPKPNGTIAPKR